MMRLANNALKLTRSAMALASAALAADMERPLSSLSMLGRFVFLTRLRTVAGFLQSSSWEVGVGGEGRTLRRRVTLICAGYARRPERFEAQSRMTVLRREVTLS